MQSSLQHFAQVHLSIHVLHSNFLHLFRAWFYHFDPILCTPDIFGGRHWQGKRKTAATQSIVDAELVEAHSDAMSIIVPLAATFRPSFPETASSSALPKDLLYGCKDTFIFALVSLL